MAVDPLDPVERLTGQRDQCKADRDADFTDDPDTRVVELRQQVVRFPDRAGEGALDRDDPCVDRSVTDGLEDGAPGRKCLSIRRGDGRPVRRARSEVGDDRLLGEGARFALEGDRY